MEIAILIDVLRSAGLPAMAQVDLGSRQNRHQPLWDLTRMSSAVLRALARRVPALDQAVSGSCLWGLPGPETYLHAVATPDGVRLDEHLTELLERPPMTRQENPRVSGRHVTSSGLAAVWMISDDNFSATQFTCVLNLLVKLSRLGEPGWRLRRRRR